VLYHAVPCCVTLCHAVPCRAVLSCVAIQDKASVAAAQVPQLLLLPPQEVTARLEALSASMKVRRSAVHSCSGTAQQL
jgi:hypothetical protein